MNARKKINKLILEHQKEFGFHSNFGFMNELLAELEEERDEFAKGFVIFVIERIPKMVANKQTGTELLKEFKATLK